MALYERMQEVMDKYETLAIHFMELNAQMCQLVVDVLGTGITSPESYKEFQRLMMTKEVAKWHSTRMSLVGLNQST